MKRILSMLLTSLLMFSCDPEELIVELDVTTSSTDVTTYGGKNGSITVTVKSGNGGYLYSLKSKSNKIVDSLFINLSSDNKTSYVFKNLPSDNYQITVTDSEDKKFTHSIIINEPNPDDLSVSFDYTPSVTTYGGEDGNITITVESGYKPFEYHINDTKYENINEYTYTFDKLSGGDYNIKVVDSLGREKTEKLIIYQPSELTMSLEKTDVMCFGGSDGKITITATGENGEYQYKLNDGNYQDNNIFNGLTKGQYTVWVKCSNGVSINDNIDITEPTILSFTYNVTHPTTTEQNGTITIDANGGTSPYKYRLNNDQFKDNNTLNVKDGTHSITVMDNNECTKIESDIVVNKFIPEQPIVNIKAATNATGTTVTLNGEVNPNGGTTSLYFEYGSSTSYGNTINISNKTGNTTVGVSTNLTFETGYKVGDELHGGTIFKVDGFYPDQTGLIAWNEDENDKGWRDFFYKQYGDYDHNTFGTWMFANYDRKKSNDDYVFYNDSIRNHIKDDRTREDKYWFTPNIPQLKMLILINNTNTLDSDNYHKLDGFYWTSDTPDPYIFSNGYSIHTADIEPGHDPYSYNNLNNFKYNDTSKIRLITEF